MTALSYMFCVILPLLLLWQPSNGQDNDSSMPSEFPSYVPSLVPSVSPSTNPTALPTPACHDVKSYRSPLELQCFHHATTSCMKWRHLGYTDRDMFALFLNCPESCKATCGTLLEFEVPFRFIMKQETFLSPESTAVFQQTSANFLTTHIVKETGSQFWTYSVQLVSQTMRDEHRLRTNNDGLQISILIRGLAVSWKYDMVVSSLERALTSRKYLQSLQLADTIFDNSEIMFEVENEQVPSLGNTVDPIYETDTSSGRWVIVVSIVSAVLFAAVALFLSQRAKRRASPPSRRSTTAAAPKSPLASPVGNLLGFETVLRIMSSMSPEQAQEEESSETHQSQPTSTDASQRASPTESTSPKEHPLTGIIPPMLVYTDIDGPDGPDSCRESSVVPSKKQRAPPGLLESNALDSSMYDGILHCNPEIEDSENSNPNGLIKLHRPASSVQLSSNLSPVKSSQSPRFILNRGRSAPDLCEPPPKKQRRPSPIKIRGDGTRHTVVAPRSGKLGLIIKCPDNRGPAIVTLVKPFSMFIGSVKVGDHILQINGASTKDLSLDEITGMISVNNTSPTIEFYIWRPAKPQLERSSTH